MDLKLDTPLIELPRLGIRRLSAAAAAKLATALAPVAEKREATDVTIEDLLNYFPSRYEDRSHLVQIDEISDGMESAVEIYVKLSGGYQVGRNRNPRQPPLFIFEISGTNAANSERPVIVKWFVSGKQARNIVKFYDEKFARGTRFVAYGRWEWDKTKQTFSLMVPKPDEIEILRALDDQFLKRREADGESTEEHELEAVHAARKVPIYRKLGEFQTKRLREIIYEVLQQMGSAAIEDELPAALRQRVGLLGRADALREIHFPPDAATMTEYAAFKSPAQRRLIFEEFFWLSFSMQLLRGDRQKAPKGTVIEIAEPIRDRLRAMLPFELTAAQTRVVREIFEDMSSDAPMNRLIQGDVGSGKTIVAFLAAFAAIANGYQAALMAPTEILAEQHRRTAERYFPAEGYDVELLTSGRKAAEKRKAYERIASGEVSLVIGTHAVIQEGVKFSRLGLAIIDEQHRFGVLQRAQLQALGRDPDVLVMTATPIPRSLAMTVYGDLDVSIIDELPPGRTPVKTVVVGQDQRQGVYKGIEREIRRGRQVYIVYPLVDESEKLDLKAAKIMYDDLRARTFPQFSIGLLHGRMKTKEKDEVMGEFVAGRLNILVSTTVIEVGVDVPNASLMVIEHAEQFGLSQLHQLRGRVGRGSEQSFCVLLTEHKKTAVAKERLGIMEQTSDGFVIAEKDLEIRGQGEILGTRQSGVQNFKLGNIVRDLEILMLARDAAAEYLNEHRNSPETRQLVRSARSDRRLMLGQVG